MDKDIARERIKRALQHLGLLTAGREETILALLDDETPSDFRALAEKGLTFASGARTRQILNYIAHRLGKDRKMDRELRDAIMLPLREVGVLLKGYADTKAGQVTLHFWKPKSPNNVYVLNPQFRALLEASDVGFADALTLWERATPERRHRVASAEAAAFAHSKDHRLVSVALAAYCHRFLPGYRVVFVDDTDGQRIAPEWRESVERLGLPLDLASRWPDIILNAPETNRCWVVDCVETDGEVDPVRHKEILEAFESRGLTIDGFTTVYRTARRFAERQSQVDNIAPDTYIWIAELGGGQFRKEPLKQV